MLSDATVARPVAIGHKVSLKPKHCGSATLIEKTLKNEPKRTTWRSHFWDHMHSLVKEQKKSTFTVPFLGPSVKNANPSTPRVYPNQRFR